MREADDAHLAAGTDVGGYVVDGELGSGGMGVVYSATHPLIGKRAAIKVLRPELSDNPAAVERFMLEARAVNQIGHPNIVDIFAFGTLPDGRSYYVMDLLQGEPLRGRIKRGPLHVSEAASVLDEIASALIAAHDKGIIHRDLKPDNVFMVSVPGRWPEVRILDWGVLKLSSTQGAGRNHYKTLAGSMLGTPVYMSPEQARASESVDARTDVYSLGVLAYEILSGAPPFQRGSSIDTVLAHQEEPVPPLAPKCPGLPEELIQLIEAMLAKQPEGRPTLTAVRAVIKRLRSSKIPTMTAAGLQLPTAVPSRAPDEPDTEDYPTLARDPLPLPAPPLTPIGGETPMTATLAGHIMPSASNPKIRPPTSPAYAPAYSQPHMSNAQMSQPAMPPPYASLPQVSQPQQVPAPAASGNRVVVILVVALISSAIGIYLLVAS